MIVIIDDRISRRQNKIGDINLPEFIRCFDLPEIDKFIEAVLNREHLEVSDVKLLCVHRNIPKLYEEEEKKQFTEFCKRKKLPLIWFGGDYSSTSSLEEGQVFICNASMFYESLFHINDVEGNFLAERMLFGKGFKASFLMSIRRLIRHLIQSKDLDKLDQTRKRFVQFEFKDLFQSLTEAKTAEDKLALLDKAVDKELLRYENHH